MPRIHHISLEVRPDLVASEIRFWEILGYARVDPPEEIGDASVWLGYGEEQIHLLPVTNPALPDTGHVALVADDLERTVVALGEAGFTVRSGKPYWGAVRAKVATPSGHLVELMESAPA
jgi:catechol 2,3-dioxygenase-like lactoylglutathione lyase family enzyme